MDKELRQCLENDSSIRVNMIDGNDTSVTWVGDALATGRTSLADDEFLKSLKHGEWTTLDASSKS